MIPRVQGKMFLGIGERCQRGAAGSGGLLRAASLLAPMCNLCVRVAFGRRPGVTEVGVVFIVQVAR